MPTYTYQCRKCGYAFDVFHAMTARPRVKCMKCGAGCKRRIGAGAAIIFKGSGFYETDYKKRDGKPSARPETPKTEAKTEAKSEPKTESKTASKPKGTDQD